MKKYVLVCVGFVRKMWFYFKNKGVYIVVNYI